MSQPLTIQIPDPVFQCLQERAKQLGKTPEVVAAECIAQSVGPAEDDPLMKLFGSIDSGRGDVWARHDEYLGQALADEMRAGAHE